MALPIAAGLSLIPSIFQGLKGISQSRQAKKINPIDPGYQMNSQVVDNARMLGERYTNYQMPGFGAAQDQIAANSANAFNSGIQGVSSSGDMLDLASKIAYGSNQANNQLYTQNAIGKEGALKDYLGANVAAGQEYQDKNAFDRERYMDALREKAALSEAGTTNLFGSLNNVAATGTALATSGLLGGEGNIGDLSGATQPISGVNPITKAQIPTKFSTPTIPSFANMSQDDYLKALQQQIGFRKI